jgi:iron complex transport system substrate-binding protein
MKKLAFILVLLLAGLAQAQYPLSIKHHAGETVIAKKPERVVVLGEELMELLIPLGIKPVGYGSSRVRGLKAGEAVMGLTYYDPADVGPAVYVGDSFRQPNLEAILALKPDLILFWAAMPATVVEALKKIAPAVGWDYNRDEKVGWRGAFVETAKMFNLERLANDQLRRYDEQLQAFRARVAPIVARSPKVTSLFFFNEQFTGVFGPKFGFSIALTRLGFELVPIPGVAIPDQSYAPVSTEVLVNVKSDWVIYLRAKTPDNAYPELTSERMLKQAKIPTYRFLLDTQEPQSGPITDLRRIEGIVKLLEAGPIR